MEEMLLKEKWKDIKGYEGFYQISNYGRIKSLVGWNGKEYVSRNKLLNPWKQSARKNSNYYRSLIRLSKKGESKKDFKIHRLVAEHFIPNPNNYKIINHKDGNPLNNHVENLEWCTQRYNMHHAIENDLLVRRINTIDRKDMLVLLNSGRNYDEIAEILNIAKGTVFNYIKKFNIKKKFI